MNYLQISGLAKEEKGERGCMKSLLSFLSNQITKPQIQLKNIQFVKHKMSNFILITGTRTKYLFILSLR